MIKKIMDLIKGCITISLLLMKSTSFCSASNGLSTPLDISHLEVPGSGNCQADFQSFKVGLDSGQTWALTMWDASVKAPVGLFSQTAIYFGDFDECLTVNTPVTAQYCLMDIHGNFTKWSHFRWALCVPASCSPHELQTAVQNYMDTKVEGVKVQIMPLACTTRETTSSKFTRNDIIYCLVIAAIFGIVGIATAHDFVMRPNYDGNQRPNTVRQCFSVRHGLSTLVQTQRHISGVDFSSFDGIHAVTSFFIVFGHRYIAMLHFMAVTNYSAIENDVVHSWKSLWLDHFDLLVDIFFFLSAFLMSFTFFSLLDKQTANPIRNILLRLSRIVPVYTVVMFFYATLLRHLGSGPMWNLITAREGNFCRNNWWANLLFINTYIHRGHICLFHSWHLTTDFQLYLLGIVLVLVLHRNFRVGCIILVFVFTASTTVEFLGTYLHDGPAMLLFDKEFVTNPRLHEVFNTLYSQAHYRGTSYLPGLLTGIYVYKHRTNTLSKRWTYVMQALGITIGQLVWSSGIFFYNKDFHLSLLSRSLYAATFHTAFGLSLALLVISFTLGKPTFLSSLASWKGFIPLSKLSYCVFLVHMMVQIVWAGKLRTHMYFTYVEFLAWTLGDTLISLAIALVLYLTVETPARNLAKLILLGAPSSSSQSTKKDD